jgi:hypothetical protein
MQNAETRRAGLRRASEMVLARNSSESTRPAADIQAAWVLDRFAVSAAVARVISEHAFNKGTRR